MTMERREADKPNPERKEAKKKMPVGALSKKEIEEIEKSKLPFVIRFAKTKMLGTVQQPAKEADALLHDGLSQFERQLIQECREDGMSDREIREWMQEI